MEQMPKHDGAVVQAQTRALQTVDRESYWARIGRAYRVCFRILLVALPLFVVMFVAICSRAFTYDSIFCFFKDLRSTSSFIPSDNRTVTYTYEEGERNVIPYRGGVAAVTTGGVEVYSPDGERLLELAMPMSSPRAAASRKYVVAFDFGQREFAVTNSYARLHRGTTEHPIYMAEVADTGQIALVTASDTYLSQVLLYDTNFHLIQSFGRASATVGVSVSDNGKYIAILSLDSKQGKREAVLQLYRIGFEKPTFSVSFAGETPVALSFTDHRHIAVVTDGALRVLDMDGEWEEEIRFDGAALTSYAFSDTGAMLSLCSDRTDAAYRTVVVDRKGRLAYDEIHAGEDVRAIALGEEQIFLLAGNRISRIGTSDGVKQEITCESGATQIFAMDDERLRVVYAGKAEYIYFGEKEE